LNEQQFAGANAVLEKCYQQAAQQNLLQETFLSVSTFER
jgi:hypothetical protein